MSRKFRLTEEQRTQIGQRFKEIIVTDYNYENLQKFADEWQISRATLQHWITEGMINIGFLKQFCETFNIDLRWLLFGPPYPKHQKPTKS